MRSTPPNSGCTGSKKRFRINLRRFRVERVLGRHDWTFSHHWNGNSKKILPFMKHTNGLPRSGWRCSKCGEFAWAESDHNFSANHAVRFSRETRSAFNHARGLDKHGRHPVHDYTQESMPFRVRVVGTKSCAAVIVETSSGKLGSRKEIARWSSGDILQDLDDFEEWLSVFSPDVIGVTAARAEAAVCSGAPPAEIK